jgi:hypothetical protein
MSNVSQELSGLGNSLEVIIRYGNLEKKVSGPPEQVAREVLSFLTSVIPRLELASKLSLSVDLAELAKTCEGIIAVTQEGLVVTAPVDGLTDRELILLHLVKGRIGEMAGKTKTGTVQSSELITATKRTGGTVAGRLSELCAESLAERKAKGEYRATTLGLHVFHQTILPKLKQGRGGT